MIAVVRKYSKLLGAAITTLSFALPACLEPMAPSGDGKRDETPVENPEEKPKPNPELKPRTSEPTVEARPWQKITITLQATDGPLPTRAVVGFDQVLTVFSRESYGPCTSCHATEWPYLSTTSPIGSWNRFLESLNVMHRDVSTLPDLATLLVACIDQEDEAHCNGEPDDASDNIDYKMPTKFGYDPVSGEDLQIVKQWIADGLAPESQAASTPSEDKPSFNLATTTSVQLSLVPANAIEFKAQPVPSPMPNGDEIQLVLFARPQTLSCRNATAAVELKGPAEEKYQFKILFQCSGPKALLPKYIVLVPRP